MRRALFFREFRSALVPNLVTVGTILATLIAVEYFYGLRLGKVEEKDVRGFIDLVLVIGLVVSGCISGERCFPSELKESRMLFLSSLPISRTGVWLCIVSARLLAGLATLTLTLALRRPLLGPLFESQRAQPIGLLIGWFFFAYVLFFSMGALFALLFRRTLFSYIAGSLALGILLSETLFSVSYYGVEPRLEEIWLNPLYF